jgi:mono/diheme cytochrome c family protein
MAADPHTEYMLDCMGCHQANGAGLPGKVPDMRGVLGRLSGTAAGRRYLIEVPGVAQAPLSSAQLAALLNWMVHELGDHAGSRHFTEFTPTEVAAYRKTPLVEVAAVRQRLLGGCSRTAPDSSNHRARAIKGLC